MRIKRKDRFLVVKVAAIALYCTGILFLLEPVFRDKVIFAVSYFDTSKIPSSSDVNNYFDQGQAQPAAPQKTHAPEPGTILLFLSGIGGMIVRFARRSFAKFKRAMDYFLAAFGLALSSPIVALAAIFIKLDSPGPVIYKQKRVGKAGRIFRIYKLRTMRIDAEKLTGAVWARENDPRITIIGRLLRKTHIDEIPQFINVLKGEMSIVGPRPERPEMVRDLKELICDYEKRLQIQPGITGMAQVLHKYDETIADVRKKIKYDMLYIKKMCWLVEMRILAQTFVVALSGKGAR